MAMTAMNTQPVQGQQVGGAPPASADILMQKRKKKPLPSHEPTEGAKHWSQTKASADILTRRKK